jgi:hypothetical protein
MDWRETPASFCELVFFWYMRITSRQEESIMKEWYFSTLREIRQAVEQGRLSYYEGVLALEELARIRSEDAALVMLWQE